MFRHRCVVLKRLALCRLHLLALHRRRIVQLWWVLIYRINIADDDRWNVSRNGRTQNRRAVCRRFGSCRHADMCQLHRRTQLQLWNRTETVRQRVHWHRHGGHAIVLGYVYCSLLQSLHVPSDHDREHVQSALAEPVTTARRAPSAPAARAWATRSQTLRRVQVRPEPRKRKLASFLKQPRRACGQGVLEGLRTTAVCDALAQRQIRR